MYPCRNLLHGAECENKKSKTSKVIWTDVVDPSDTFNRQLIWEKTDDKDQFYIKRANDNTLIIKNEYEGGRSELDNKLYNQQIELNLFDLGRSVPKANTMENKNIPK